MIPVNALSKPHLDALAGFALPANAPAEEEVERRAQEILKQWTDRYFTGAEFQSPDGEGMVAKRFLSCEILWDQATPTQPAVKPILHFTLVDRRDGEPRRVGGGLYRVDGEWTWNVLARTHPQLPAGAPPRPGAADTAKATAFRDCRRAADQLRWLLLSAHAQELTLAGIRKVKVASGPRPLAGGAEYLRQIVFTGTFTYHFKSNEPG